MRKSLLNLIEKTIIFEYELPNNEKQINKIHISTDNDHCLSVNNENNLVSIIYNSILEYSYSELNVPLESYQYMHSAALKNKLKYIENSDKDEKYGFFGEVFLCSLLYSKYAADRFISRGIFYDPLKPSETTGYDSYHIIDKPNCPELWFGEVKFHKNHISAIKSVMSNIEKALSDNYFTTNLLTIQKNIRNIEPNGEIIKNILNNNLLTGADILEQIKGQNIKLVYPIFIVYQATKNGYDDSIKKVVDDISEKYENLNVNMSIPFSVFFILLPIENVAKTKQEVINWIKLKQPVLQ